VSGDVVVVPFPFTHLEDGKRRPALVLADVGLGDHILCQITSKDWHQPAVRVSEEDFVEGGLERESFVRPDRDLTVHEQIVLYAAGRLSQERLEEVREVLIRCIRDRASMTAADG